jgi:hypothetical protein
MSPRQFATQREIQRYAAQSDRMVVSKDLERLQHELPADQFEVVELRAANRMIRLLLVARAALKARWEAERPFYNKTLQAARWQAADRMTSLLLALLLVFPAIAASGATCPSGYSF